MLYITTRNNKDAHTSSWPLRQDRAPDGGMYVPFRIPMLEQNEITALKDKTFGETVAQILNLFFSCQLSGWDVDFCIGRSSVKLQAINRRIVVAETWHNPQSAYVYAERSLYEQICKDPAGKRQPTDWAIIAIRISMLFGVYGQMLQGGLTDGTQPVDIAVNAGDFSAPMAAWYARQMGLPIGTIICSCSENGSLWDLIRRGEFDTGAVAKKTGVPDMDITLPVSLERLIFGTLGAEETQRYLEACKKGRTFIVPEEKLCGISDGMFAAVIGQNRVDSIVQNVRHTNFYTLDTLTAMAYGGLQDYRASTGESRPTLLLSEVSPLNN